MNAKRISILTLTAAALTGLTSCVDHFLPDTLDAFDKEAAFSTTVYRPTLGRNTVFSNNFNAGNSTRPLTFTLTNVKRADGSAAPELTDTYPVQVWKSPYLGTETSLAEIEAKRTTENRPLLQVRKHSGEVIVYANTKSSFVKVSPDAGYTFDVKVENSGGYKYFTGLKLIPVREADYEPNNMDSETGFVTEDYVHPVTVRDMYFASKSSMSGIIMPKDVNVFIQRNYDDKDEATTLTFRFLDENFKTINPAKFNTTKWESLVHGFNMQKTDEYVRYEVAYPVPLNDIPSKYTDITGEKAHVAFTFDRIHPSGIRLSASMTFDFAIYTEGDWEVVFVFAGGTPQFEDNK